MCKIYLNQKLMCIGNSLISLLEQLKLIIKGSTLVVVAVERTDAERIKSIFSGNDSFTKHEPCPRCNSRDNLARYKSGSAWCFGCGYFERGGVVFKQTKPDDTTVRIKSITDDCDNFYGVKVLRWIDQYGLTP